MATIAIRQARGLAAAAEQQALLASCREGQALGAAGGAIGQLRGAATAAEQAAVARQEEADFGERDFRHGGP
ncbi:hypothetical protein D3C85_1485960 [compost metagenome]